MTVPPTEPGTRGSRTRSFLEEQPLGSLGVLHLQFDEVPCHLCAHYTWQALMSRARDSVLVWTLPLPNCVTSCPCASLSSCENGVIVVLTSWGWGQTTSFSATHVLRCKGKLLLCTTARTALLTCTGFACDQTAAVTYPVIETSARCAEGASSAQLGSEQTRSLARGPHGPAGARACVALAGSWMPRPRSHL